MKHITFGDRRGEADGLPDSSEKPGEGGVVWPCAGLATYSRNNG